ncbi:flagellar protein FlbT [Pseudoroseicyclus aestuarii]|uniref:Flagellar protein FlbT n=1 Tax=Pseudoroseicyclus aestuarii TaxID=1795041 RepID=A0A318SRX1_9RHOB|nr:flagellar protein FlbT [Pseudoroseicyclus aestuarii]
MTGLVLKLGPQERVLVNGAVIENGDRRSRLSILTPNAKILRLRDAIRPGEADTPVKRVCYIAQLVLAGEATPAQGHTQMISGVEQLSQVLTDPDSRALLSEATTALRAGETYRALKRLRALLPREERLMAMSRSAPPAPARPELGPEVDMARQFAAELCDEDAARRAGRAS